MKKPVEKVQLKRCWACKKSGGYGCFFCSPVRVQKKRRGGTC